MGRRCIPDVVWRIFGFSNHLKRESVHPVNVSVEEAIRSMIRCGTGSGKPFKSLFGKGVSTLKGMTLKM
jgi:hypothetical protein